MRNTQSHHCEHDKHASMCERFVPWTHCKVGLQGEYVEKQLRWFSESRGRNSWKVLSDRMDNHYNNQKIIIAIDQTFTNINLSGDLKHPRNICERSINFKAFINQINIEWRNVKKFSIPDTGYSRLDAWYSMLDNNRQGGLRLAFHNNRQRPTWVF